MRLDFDVFKEISTSLSRNKTRSILTGFGIFWGLFMLLFLSGGGQGFKQLLMNSFAGFANNITVLVSNTTTRPFKGYKQGRYWNFTLDDVQVFKAQIPGLKVVTPQVFIREQAVMFEDRVFGAAIKGNDSEYLLIEEPEIKYGRYLNDMDILQQRKVCVLGKNIYNTLFPDGGDPCGNRVKIGEVYFTVIGVDTKESSMAINSDSQSTVVIPINVALKIYRNNANTVDVICVRAADNVKTSILETQIRKLVSRKKSLDPEDKQAIVVLNIEEMFALIDNLFRGLNFLILLIGIGTILAGAIGVSNIMMVSVKERTTEIGIRRAIGATPKDILTQIILEGSTLTTIAGMGAIVFTVLILGAIEKGVSASQGSFIAFQIGFWPAIFATLGVILVGILAALAPAMRAMKIRPVDAMRDE